MSLDTTWYLDKIGSIILPSGLTVGRFRGDYAATKILSKCVGLKTGIDTEEVALVSAVKAENACRVTNWVLRQNASSELAAILHRAAQVVARILPAVPAEFGDVGWSKGRTTSAFGEMKTPAHKYAARPDTTVSALTRATKLVRASPHWGSAVLDADGPVSVLSRGLNKVRGSTLTAVPKNAKTDRIIRYEPHLNIRLQLQVGSFLKGVLLSHGINLRDQSVNRRRARLGSRFGHLATIDLSSASDMIAYELIWKLLPIDWACLLDDLRSHDSLWPDGTWRRTEMFSSMGNGFTFELESLLFYALASAVTTNVSVYGDDIIVPTESYDAVRTALELCGFVINSRKSFGSGTVFRESCGGDYFDGLDCTPPFIRAIPKSFNDVVKIHNMLRRWCSRTGFIGRAEEDLFAKWRTAFPMPLGPSTSSSGEELSDGHYHVNFDSASPLKSEGWLDGWWYYSYAEVRNTERDELNKVHYGALICAAVGPKASSGLETQLSPKEVRYKKTRCLANFIWPSVTIL